MAQDKILAGYEQVIGAKLQVIVDHFGPVSYSQTTGDVYPATNLNRGGFDKVTAGITLDNAYSVLTTYPASASAGGGTVSVVLVWNFATTGSVASVAQNVAGSGQTPGTYTVAATGGGGTGASISVVVATATTLGAITVLNPGKGYTSAPTFTLVSGGTPATLTATLSVAGAQVATGANLSGSAVRLEAIMY